MAEATLNVKKIIENLREIVKRKTIFDDTNLHFDYFKLTGETIPFKDYGYPSLRKLIESKASEHFYFENIAKDLVFIAPKKLSKLNESPSPHKSSDLSESSSKTVYVKSIELNPSKRICVTSNIEVVSSDEKDPAKRNGRKDIRISFDFGGNESPENVETLQVNRAIKNIKEEKEEDFVDKPLPKAYAFTYDYASAESLPWDEKYWHLKITNPSSTYEVWAQFCGDFEHPEMNIATMEAGLFKAITYAPIPPNKLSTKEVYVLKHKKQYHRIKISKLMADLNQCKCFLIDVGTIRVGKIDNIFCCPTEFRSVPPLAIRFSLYGLDEFADNRNARDILTAELMDRCVWAKLKIKNSEYDQTKDKRPIPVILYDLATNKSRKNLNAWLIDKLIETFSPPKLSPDDTNYMTVSHISKSTGTIYCHVTSGLNDLRYVIGMIERYVGAGVYEHFADISSGTDLHKLIASQPKRLYLVYCEHEKCFYRATILQLETDYTETHFSHIVYCFLVDYGNIRAIRLKNVFELSGVLAKYPYFAVAVKLAGIKMTEEAYKRLKEVLMPGDSVMIRAVQIVDNHEQNKTKSIAHVKMMKFFQHGHKTKLCVVNELI